MYPGVADLDSAYLPSSQGYMDLGSPAGMTTDWMSHKTGPHGRPSMRGDQPQPGGQQQQQDELAECRIVKLAIELEAEPQAGQQRRQAEHVQFDRFCRDRAGQRQGNCRHDNGRQHDRLKDGALHVLAPTAQLAPDPDDESREPGDTAEKPVQESDAAVSCGSARHRLQCRLGQAVEAVDDQEQADAAAQIGRIDIGEQQRPDGDADRAADDERRHILPAQRVPQLPHAIALRAQAVEDDQRRRLDRRDHVQPDAGHDEAHGKAGDAGCETADERRQQKDSKNDTIHDSFLAIEASSAWMAMSIWRGGRNVPCSAISERSKNQGPADMSPSREGDGAWAHETTTSLDERGDRRRPRVSQVTQLAPACKRSPHERSDMRGAAPGCRFAHPGYRPQALRMRNTNSALSLALCSSTSPVSRTRLGMSIMASGSVHSSTSASPAASRDSALRALRAGRGHFSPRRSRTVSAMCPTPDGPGGLRQGFAAASA